MKKTKPLMNLYRRYSQAEISTRAAALAFHTLLGIVPTIGITFWYLRSLNLMQHYVAETRTFVMAQLNVGASDSFAQHFDKLTEKVEGSSWGWVGLVLLIYSAWGLISKFGDSLDFILTSSIGERKVQLNFKWFALFLRRVGVMLLLPVALMLSLALSQWLRKDSVFHYLFDLKTVGPMIAWPLAWIASIVSMALTYYFVPRVKVPPGQALKAALVVGPLSEVVRYFFGLYNAYAVRTDKIYGVLAVVPLFILWVQIAWLLLLCGALLIRPRTR